MLHHLAYIQDTHLTVVPFDAAGIRLSGNPVSTDIRVGTALLDETGAANFDVARNGTLIVQLPWQTDVFRLVGHTSSAGRRLQPPLVARWFAHSLQRCRQDHGWSMCDRHLSSPSPGRASSWKPLKTSTRSSTSTATAHASSS
jgi:hypothetical protein